jgi:hypothetical protein
MKPANSAFVLAVCGALAAGALASLAIAQYQGIRVDNGQQYWNNYWKAQSQRPMQSQYGAARIGSPYSAAPTPQKPFSNYRPAPNAFQNYWPLMVYPNSFGSYF